MTTKNSPLQGPETGVVRGNAADLPSALDGIEEILVRRGERRLAVFLDYDGVLTPIVPRPEDALLSGEMREAVTELAGRCTVAIVSGRDLADVRRLAAVPGIACAGSHGFEIDSTDGRFTLEKGVEHLPALDRAEGLLAKSLAGFAGVRIERKRFAIAVHYRQASDDRVPAVREVVERTLEATEGLRLTGGKKIFELRPDIDWDKGKAVTFLLEKLGVAGAFPLYLGDDLTDEDAFRELRGTGVGIYVGEETRPTAAAFRLEGTAEVQRFLARLARLLGDPAA